MKNILFVLLLIATESLCQQSEMDKLKSINFDSLALEIEKSTATLNSVMQAGRQQMEMEAHYSDSISSVRNLDWFIAQRKEQEQKQNRSLIITGEPSWCWYCTGYSR